MVFHNFFLFLLLLLLLLLKWLYNPMQTLASLMDFSQSSSIDLTDPRPHLRFPNCRLFPEWDNQSHAQPPTWRTRSPYFYPLENEWHSYTPKHRVPILVAFYDMRALQWDYSFPRSPHGEITSFTLQNISYSVVQSIRDDGVRGRYRNIFVPTHPPRLKVPIKLPNLVYEGVSKSFRTGRYSENCKWYNSPD
jgi:hypothetical protein